VNLLPALLYRLFAGKSVRPRTTLQLRFGAFAGALVLMALIAYKCVPLRYAALLQINFWQLTALLCTVTYALVTLLCALLDGYQKSLLSRLDILQQLPLFKRQLQRLYLIAYVPLGLVVTAITLPALVGIFRGCMGRGALLAIIGVALGLALASNMLLRVASSRFNTLSQPLRLAGIMPAAYIAWSLQGPRPHAGLVGLAACFIAAQVIFCLYLASRPVHAHYARGSRPVVEYHHIGLVRSFFVRAIRTARYRAANVVVVIIFMILTSLARYKPAVMSFDAAALVALLLCGTLGQETRSLSKPVYPIELLEYGLLRRWVFAMWALVFINAAVLTLGILACASWLFPFGLSVSHGYLLCVAACLTGVGILAGSLTAPHKRDMLAQLGATGVYTAGAWAVIKLMAWVPAHMLVWVTAGVVCGSLAIAFLAERFRWLITIRRFYGCLFCAKRY